MSTDFKIRDGIVYGYCGQGGDVVIPDGVVLFASDCVLNSGKKPITSLTLPKSFLGLSVISPKGKLARAGYYCKVDDGKANVLYRGSGTFHGKKKRIKDKLKDSYKCFTGQGLSALTSFDVHPENPVYKSHDGLLYCRDFRMLLSCPMGKKGKVVVHEATTLIAANAFDGCKGLTEIVLPKGFTTFDGLGRGTIPELDVLNAFEVHAENQFYSTYEGMLYSKNFSSLISCPRSISGRVELHEATTSIARNALDGCIGITELVLPKRLSSLDGICAENTPHLPMFSSIEVHADNRFYSSFDGLLYNKDFSKLLYCPTGKQGRLVLHRATTAMAKRVFEKCRDLREIVLPDGFTTFEDSTVGYFPKTGLRGLVVVGAGVSAFVNKSKDASYRHGPLRNKVLVFPKLSLSKAPKEIRPNMAIGYCVHPELYESKMAERYKASLRCTDATICELGKLIGVQAVSEYYGSEYEAICNGKSQQAKLKKKADKLKEHIVRGYVIGTYIDGDVVRKKFKSGTPRQATCLLENKVLKGSAADVRDVLSSQKEFAFTARALGLACRYGGLDKVKYLIEGGASFVWSVSTFINNFFGNFRYNYSVERRALADFSLLLVIDYFRKEYVGEGNLLNLDRKHNIAGYEVLSETKRIEIIEYLIAAGVFTKVDLGSLCFHALLFGCYEIAEYCHQKGGRINDFESLLSGRRRDFLRRSYLEIITKQNPKALIEFGRYARMDGFSFKVSPSLDLHRFYEDTLLLQGLLKNNEIPSTTIAQMVLHLIKTNDAKPLSIILHSGRIKRGAQLSKYIDLSLSSGRHEITALLLDYKHANDTSTASSKKHHLSL